MLSMCVCHQQPESSSNSSSSCSPLPKSFPPRRCDSSLSTGNLWADVHHKLMAEVKHPHSHSNDRFTFSSNDFDVSAICEEYTHKLAHDQWRYKTELCNNLKKGLCNFGQHCHFAHSENELRPRSVDPRYKTSMCAAFHGAEGVCNYGRRCCYIHAESHVELTRIQLYSQLYMKYAVYFKYSAFPPSFRQLLQLDAKMTRTSV